MRLVDGALRRPVTVLMVTAALGLFGMVAASRLAVELLPDLSYPSLTIRTDLPDASPSDVEQFVTRPVEEAAGVVPGLARVHSVSYPGQSEVTLEFVSGTRMDLASLAVREKLDLVTLPREARRGHHSEQAEGRRHHQHRHRPPQCSIDEAHGFLRAAPRSSRRESWSPA